MINYCILSDNNVIFSTYFWKPAYQPIWLYVTHFSPFITRHKNMVRQNPSDPEIPCKTRNNKSASKDWQMEVFPEKIANRAREKKAIIPTLSRVVGFLLRSRDTFFCYQDGTDGDSSLERSSWRKRTREHICARDVNFWECNFTPIIFNPQRNPIWRTFCHPSLRDFPFPTYHCKSLYTIEK